MPRQHQQPRNRRQRSRSCLQMMTIPRRAKRSRSISMTSSSEAAIGTTTAPSCRQRLRRQRQRRALVHPPTSGMPRRRRRAPSLQPRRARRGRERPRLSPKRARQHRPPLAAQFAVALMLRAKLPAKLQATRLPAVHGAVASAGWRGRAQRKRTRLGVALVAMPAAPTMVNLRLQDVRYPTVQLRVYQRASV